MINQSDSEPAVVLMAYVGVNTASAPRDASSIRLQPSSISSRLETSRYRILVGDSAACDLPKLGTRKERFDETALGRSHGN